MTRLKLLGCFTLLVVIVTPNVTHVRSQGPADISASIADAVTEVSGRRPAGGILTAAAAGRIRSQGPADISASIADAVTEVSGRRPAGGILTAAAAGRKAGFADPATGTTPAAGFLGGMAPDGNGAAANNPVSIHALFSRRREAPGAVAATGTAGDITSTATANFAARTGGLPDEAEFRRQIAPYCPVRIAICNPNDPYRTADGSCNNLVNPLWGASITSQRRFLPPEYDDPANLGTTPRIRSRISGNLLPSPRLISNVVHNAGISPPRSVIYNVALTHFSQFIAHDIISTPILKHGNNDIFCCTGDIPVIRPECFSFLVPPGNFTSVCMPFVRSDIAVDPGCPPGPRNPINQRTSYLDLSVTYGNTDDGVADLREPGTGRLLEGIGRILPDGGTECIAGEVCFKSGDNRPAEIPMLTVMHIIFLREHNNIVAKLRALGWTAEGSFHEARKIITGIYQHIIYNEYLPAVLGQEGMNMFGLWSAPFGFRTSYNQSVDASTRNSFGAAAFRFGHSLVGSFVESFKADFTRAQEPLERHFFSTRLIRDFTNVFGPDRISRWMATQFQSQADRWITPSVRDRLFETMSGNGFDLAALNIQRARDHGVPSYNRFRTFCGLQPAFHFGQGPFGLSDHEPAAAAALASVYGYPEDIDLFAGGLSERPAPGALVGRTFRCLIGSQFQMYKIGDRFFYENNFFPTGFTTNQLQLIKSQTMSALYCRTMNVNEMPVNAFVSTLTGSPRIPCQFFSGLDLRAWSRPNSRRRSRHSGRQSKGNAYK